jgi:uncharacterized protein with HEPN domain
MAAKNPLAALTDMRDAIECCIEIISEASRRLPERVKSKHADVPWQRVAAVGNVFRHECQS